MLMLFAPDMHAGFVLPFCDENGLVGVDGRGEGGFGNEAWLGAEEGLHLDVVLTAEGGFGGGACGFENYDEHIGEVNGVLDSNDFWFLGWARCCGELVSLMVCGRKWNTENVRSLSLIS